MNFYSFHIGDYASKTRHLSWEEDAAYRRLLDVYYGTEKPLPAEKRVIYRLVVAMTAKQRQAVDTILSEFFVLQPDGFHNDRCDQDLAGYQSKRDKARAAAELSVQVRQKNNSQIRADRMDAARAKATHTAKEWQAMLDATGRQCVKCGGEGPLEKDHIVPIYQGGTDGIDNLQPLCRACNAAKGPDSTDHRPSGWRENVEQTLNASSADAQRPLSERLAPTTQHPITTPSKEVSSVVARARPPDLEARLREAAGWQSDPSTNLFVTGPIEGLLQNGADLDLDVLPVIRQLAPKARGRSWKFFVTAIAQARDDRVSASKIVSAPPDRRNGYGKPPARKSTVDTIMETLGDRDGEGGPPFRQN